MQIAYLNKKTKVEPDHDAELELLYLKDIRKMYFKRGKKELGVTLEEYIKIIKARMKQHPDFNK